jgi:hypothetical protein
MSLNLKEEKSRPALAYSTSQSFISFTPGFNQVAEARRALLPNGFNGFPLPDEIYQSGATRAAQRCSQTSGKVDIMRRMKSRSDVKPAGVKVNVDEQRTRLRLLADTIVRGPIGGARANQGRIPRLGMRC